MSSLHDLGIKFAPPRIQNIKTNTKPSTSLMWKPDQGETKLDSFVKSVNPKYGLDLGNALFPVEIRLNLLKRIKDYC